MVSLWCWLRACTGVTLELLPYTGVTLVFGYKRLVNLSHFGTAIKTLRLAASAVGGNKDCHFGP